MFVCLCLFWLRQVLVKDPSEKAGVQIGSHSGGYKQQGREKGHSNGQRAKEIVSIAMLDGRWQRAMTRALYTVCLMLLLK